MEKKEEAIQEIEEKYAINKTFLEEVILENFMSHEYSRIILKPGLNLILGPNGAGKSSILLGISVALGQTYTERGEKLSQLIRRGADVARVTVVLNNSKINGKRPFQNINTDKITVTRYLKKSGDYWHLVNNRYMAKAEVEHLLKQAGINPDNALIIMHQNMVEQFTSKSDEEKLLMVEDAVGAKMLRERIIEAEKKLTELVSEQKAIEKILEEAKMATDYWRNEYEKLMKLKNLQKQREEFEREYAWSIVIELENNLERIAKRIEMYKEDLKEIDGKIIFLEEEIKNERNNFNSFLINLRALYFKLAELMKNNGNEKEKLLLEISACEEKLIKSVDNLINKNTELAITKYKKKEIEHELRKNEKNYEEINKNLEEKIIEANKKGERVKTLRKPMEIFSDIQHVNIAIASLGIINQEAEEMYILADSKYRETELKAKELNENIKKTLEEIDYRKKVWRDFIRKLIDNVNPIFNEILSSIDASGRIVLRNLEDIRSAALEIYVGFKGAELTLLNSHTQSGGERTVSTMAFLLSLQKYMMSPFRAIDEFDVHMDPLYREKILKMLLSIAYEDPNTQYIIITPGKAFVEENVNVIIVQNIEGKSSVLIKK
jgi:chromosome segregation protein